MKRKQTQDSDATNHGNNFCHPAHEHQHQAPAVAAATRYGAAVAAEAHSRYIKIHNRTLCSIVQYNYNLSGQSTLLWNRRTVPTGDEEKQKLRTQSRSGSNTIYAYKTDFSIAQTTLHSSPFIFLILTRNRRDVSRKKTLSRISTTDNQVTGTATYLFTYWGSKMIIYHIDTSYDACLYVSYEYL